MIEIYTSLSTLASDHSLVPSTLLATEATLATLRRRALLTALSTLAAE